MRLAMAPLAVLSVIGGIVLIPGVTDWLDKFLEPSFEDSKYFTDIPSTGAEWTGLIIGGVISIVGIAIAYRVYMQSTVSLGGFSYWGADGTFREFYGTREKGLLENKGLPLPFERPFWAGDEDDRVAASFGYDNMPFHPMDLGDAALREFFGFVGEGAPRPDDLDAEEIFLHGFELISPPWRGGWFSRLLRRN